MVRAEGAPATRVALPGTFETEGDEGVANDESAPRSRCHSHGTAASADARTASCAIEGPASVEPLPEPTAPIGVDVVDRACSASIDGAAGVSSAERGVTTQVSAAGLARNVDRAAGRCRAQRVRLRPESDAGEPSATAPPTASSGSGPESAWALSPRCEHGEHEPTDQRAGCEQRMRTSTPMTPPPWVSAMR